MKSLRIHGRSYIVKDNTGKIHVKKDKADKTSLIKPKKHALEKPLNFRLSG